MYNGNSVGVVVPAYNEGDHIRRVIENIPPFVDRIYVIDDASTDDTWKEIKHASERVNEHGQFVVPTTDGTSNRARVVAVRHQANQGVGGAIKSGYLAALDDEVDVVAVIAGDDQMDPAALQSILDPIVEGRADYAKGNRLVTPEHRAEIPRFRLVGNAILSILTKVASGYWTISDSQNGYTAISRRALEKIRIEDMYEFYGYCNDILVKLNVEDVVVADVPAPISYGDETSHINYSTYIPRVSGMLLRNFLWRLKEKYVIRQFHPLVLLYGLGIVGAGHWLLRTVRGVRSRGTDGEKSAQSTGNGVLIGLVFVLAMIFDRADNDQLVERRTDDHRDGRSVGDRLVEQRSDD